MGKNHGQANEGKGFGFKGLVLCPTGVPPTPFSHCVNSWRSTGKVRKICLVFIDLKKAYNRIPRVEGLKLFTNDKSG